MAPSRRRKRRTSSLTVILWAASTLFLGLGLGLLLSQQGCGKRPPKPREKLEEPVSKPSPKATPQPSTRSSPQPSPKATPQPPPKLSPRTAPLETPASRHEEQKPVSKERETAKVLPRLALVIDDLGYAPPDLVTRLCAHPVPFSVAVLPFLEHSKMSAQIACDKGKEVLLHLPMEPIGYPGPHKDPGPGAVLYDLPEKEIRLRVRQALQEILCSKGVNNHMGSRITPDRQRMTWILQEIKVFKCYFLDSRTEKNSVASEVARELKIPTVQRRVFLDDDKDFAKMERQWEQALAIARKEGQVVIIGHIYPETVEALEKLIPRSRDKVRFVRASELAK